MMMPVVGEISLMAAHTSTPLRPGMRTSSSTMSKGLSATNSKAVSPSSHSSSSRSSSALRTILTPRRNNSWSSTRSTRMLPETGATVRSCQRSTLEPTTGDPNGLFVSLRHVEMDHSVVVTLAQINDARAHRILLEEQEEVVTDQFHLVQRLIERHGRSLVGLFPHDDGAIALGLDLRNGRHRISGRLVRTVIEVGHGQIRRGGRHRLRGALSAMDTSSIIGAAQTRLKFVD